jgi:hypothetical protein
MIISQLRCALSLSKGQLARFDKLSAHPPQLAASPPNAWTPVLQTKGDQE